MTSPTTTSPRLRAFTQTSSVPTTSALDTLRLTHTDLHTVQLSIIQVLTLRTRTKYDTLLVEYAVHYLLERYHTVLQQLLDAYNDKALASELQSLQQKAPALWQQYVQQAQSLHAFYEKGDGDAMSSNAAIVRQIQQTVQRLQDSKPAITVEGVDAVITDTAKPAPAVVDSTESATSNYTRDALKHAHHTITSTFTPEESYGQYLDLHDFYHQFQNLQLFHALRTVDYVDFLQHLHTYIQNPTPTASTEQKLTTPQLLNKKLRDQQYTAFLTSLNDYLYQYVCRNEPLMMLSKVVDELKTMMREEFDQRWQAGSIEGWQLASSGTAVSGSQPANAASASSNSNPLYCSDCQKLFTKDTVFNAHLTGKKHIKAAAARAAAADEMSDDHPTTSKQNGQNGQHSNGTSMPASVAYLEFTLLELRQLLRDEWFATIEYVQRKQTRSIDEMTDERRLMNAQNVLKVDELDDSAGTQMLLEAQHADTNDDDDDDEKSDTGPVPMYNPLKLPIGLDGRPMPYWLYKLAGLNVKSKCEICGNFEYHGQKSFERHFTEWRHLNGLQALGITYTPHYHNVTRIEDAKALQQKLLADNKQKAFEPQEDEEVEDADGNVYSRKVYAMLQRQGLV